MAVLRNALFAISAREISAKVDTCVERPVAANNGTICVSTSGISTETVGANVNNNAAAAEQQPTNKRLISIRLPNTSESVICDAMWPMILNEERT